MKRIAYAAEDIQFIRDNFETMSDAKMARILHRTPAAICVQRSKLGLVRRVRKHKRTLPADIEPPRPADRPMPSVHPGHVVTVGSGHQPDQETLIDLIEAKKRMYGTYSKPIRREG